jgi:hypothetical protein
VDYRNANELIKSDKFPLPTIDDLLSYLKNTSIFTTLDSFSGFFQIPMAEKDIPKTAFVCSGGLFEFLVTPFGLKTANVFQRCMSLCLAGLIYNSCLVYVDDIVVMANGVEDLLHRMQKLKDPSGKLARYALKLQDFNFVVRYIKGKNHVDCDCLSRHPVLEATEDIVDECNDLFLFSLEEIDIESEQEKDEMIVRIKQDLKSPHSETSDVVRKARSFFL